MKLDKKHKLSLNCSTSFTRNILPEWDLKTALQGCGNNFLQFTIHSMRLLTDETPVIMELLLTEKVVSWGSTVKTPSQLGISTISKIKNVFTSLIRNLH